MLAYAASRPQPVERRPAPHAMLGIIAAHVGLLALVMSAKMDLPARIANTPLVVDLIHEDDPPPPMKIEPRLPAPSRPSTLDQPRPLVPMPPADTPSVAPSPVPLPDIGELIRPQPPIDVTPKPAPPPPRMSAQLTTPASKLRPPYPASKLASGEQAVLRLRLSIDERGRVTAVEPVGPADRAFLEAARRHLLANWRYRPATEGGQAIASSTIITLRFELLG